MLFYNLCNSIREDKNILNSNAWFLYVNMYIYFRSLTIFVAFVKLGIFNERTLPVLTRHMKGRPRVLLVGWNAALPSMLVTCLITGRNPMDEFWYTARQINNVLLALSIGVVRKSESMSGNDLF